jgi:hypothetical protein
MPSKKFIQQRFDVDSGRWVNGLGPVVPVLYHLPELLAADPSESVFVVEGERDADRLASEGLVATTSPMGAGKWREEYGRWIEGRTVYVIPDNDEPGEEHAKKVAETTGAKILRLPGLPNKGDVSDWLDSGRTAAELLELAKESAATENGHRQAGLSTFTLAELLSKEFPAGAVDRAGASAGGHDAPGGQAQAGEILDGPWALCRRRDGDSRPRSVRGGGRGQPVSRT